MKFSRCGSAAGGKTLPLHPCPFRLTLPTFLAFALATTTHAQRTTTLNNTTIEAITPTILHITKGTPHHPSIAILPQPANTTPTHITRNSLTTPRLKATINPQTGAITFTDTITHQQILAEATHAITRATVQGEPTNHVQQQWQPNPDESLYGLGQQQLGTLDLTGYDLDLWQHNTNVVVPFLVSSRGYGIFWNNTSFTRFGDLRPFTPIPAYALFDDHNTPGGLTLTYPNTPTLPTQSANLNMTFHPTKAAPQAPAMEWNGTLQAPETGDYQLRANFNGGLKIWIDDHLVINHWLQTWLTSDNQIKFTLTAGQRYKIRILTDPEQQTRMTLLWKTPTHPANTSLWSEVGDAIDYYFVYGPSLDDVLANYRTLTGRATMMPQWAFGLWQSRQRYETAQQSLDVVSEFRRRKIPLDNIVQDWQYWPADSWGSHQFDPKRFPNPAAWLQSLHDQHAHVMISVWGKFNPNTDNARAMQQQGFLYQPPLQANLKDWIGFPYTFYDAFNPSARKLFWRQLNTNLFSKHPDAWWMDASEPDLLPGEPPATVEDQKAFMNPTAMGTAARMLNGWGLENANGIFTGQREQAPNQRVFILTRSGFAGQQRYSTATWSGDITATWTALAKQIPAGLGMSLSGVPYWTTDTAGYTLPQRFTAHPDVARNPADEDEFRELNARWFEWSTFTPLLRVHGELRPREMYLLGKDPATGSTDTPVYNAELKFDRIRYALFPYLYSLAGAVTQHQATIMRPLVMDFPTDAHARTLTDEYLFGPALLIAPITHYQQRSREVYLPHNSTTTVWYNLWTGQPTTSQTITAEAPYDQIPVFVRAGTILPLGPEIQYIGEKPTAPLTLQIFTGADGHFTLYEDNGLTNDYEKGAFTEIPLTYTDSTHTLTIGPRQGAFPEMQTTRTFAITVTDPTHPIPFTLTPTSTQTITYTGKPISLVSP